MDCLGKLSKHISNTFSSINSRQKVYLMAWFCDNLRVGAFGRCLWKVFELVWPCCLILHLLCCLLLLHFQTFVGCLTFQLDHSYSLASPFCGNVKPGLPVVSRIRLRKGRWSSSHAHTHMSQVHITIAMSIIADGDCQCWTVCKGHFHHTWSNNIWPRLPMSIKLPPLPVLFT